MAAPTIDQIRAAIKVKIEGVVGEDGVVHDYERYAKEQAAFKELFVAGDPPRVHGYFIRRVSTREVLADTDRWVIYHGWRIRGFMALSDADATEKLFDAEIESIRDAFRADDELANGGQTLVFSLMPADQMNVGIQVLDSKPVLFTGVLCHSVELGLTTQHLVGAS